MNLNRVEAEKLKTLIYYKKSTEKINPIMVRLLTTTS